MSYRVRKEVDNKLMSVLIKRKEDVWRMRRGEEETGVVVNQNGCAEGLKVLLFQKKRNLDDWEGTASRL